MTYEKTLAHPKANEDQRRGFQARIKAHEAAGRPIVYIDESGFATDMARTHGHGPGGKRCLGRHDRRAAGRANVIGALVAGLLPTTLPCDFNIDGDIVHARVSGERIPKPPPGAVPVMDNAGFHKRRHTQKAISDARHILQYLPPISNHSSDRMNGYKINRDRA